MVTLQVLPVCPAIPDPPESDGGSAPQFIPITAAWQLDLAGQRLVGTPGEVLLPALEFRLLEAFQRHPQRVLSRDQLLAMAWGPGFDGTDRAVDRAVCRLRHILEPDHGRPRYIRTRRGAGYSYCPSPSVP